MPVASSNEADLREKCHNLLDFDYKLSVISLLLEIFRRLNAISIAFYTPIATHAAFSVDTIPTVRKVRPFTPFRRKLGVISILLEIFRRLYAISIAFYFPNAMYASCIVEWSRPARKMRQFTRLWRQTERYFAIVGDISTFIRYFHFSLHAECDVCQLHPRMKQTCAKNATICSILKKTVRYIRPLGDILTLKRYFHCILHAECYARRF